MESLIDVLLILGGLYVYLSLSHQINARQKNGAPSLGEKRLGLPEAIAAALLVGWFALTMTLTIKAGQIVLTTRDLIQTAIFSFCVIAALSTLLRMRGFNVISLGGFSRLGFGRIVSTAAVLLLAAYPLLAFAEWLGRSGFGDRPARQEIIEMFTGSETMQQRIMIIVLAISIAPLTEEFIFRFFLYGVLKRYFGRAPGLVLNSLLFAAVHLHLPSFGPLFILGSCLTLAYEWSGSILVPMTMHALFNFFSLSLLAFPNLFPQ